MRGGEGEKKKQDTRYKTQEGKRQGTKCIAFGKPTATEGRSSTLAEGRITP